MQLGHGAGKTEAMAFMHDAQHPTLGLPPLHAGEHDVSWAAQYKYLGYILQWDLSNSGMITRLRKRLNSLNGMLFIGNRLVRSLSPSLQLQLATTLVTGSCAYLMGVVPFTEAETQVLTSAVHKLGRVILSLPSISPNILTSSATRLPCFFSTMAMHHERLYHHLRCTPFRDGVAVRLFEFMCRDPPRTQGRASCWLHRYQRARDEWCRRGALPLPDAAVQRHWHVHRAAAVLGRSVAWTRWRYELQSGTNAHGRSVDITTRPTHLPLRRQHVAELHFLGSLPSSGLGERAFSTPQRYTGAGATSVEALSTIPAKALRALSRIRLGRMALTG